MIKMTVALMLGTVLAIGTAAHANEKTDAQKAMHRPFRGPVVASYPNYDPNWVPDYNIVPRYRYNPRDDRVDTSPYAKPVAPGDPEPGPLGPYGQ